MGCIGGALSLRMEGDGSMKKIMLLMTAILVISYLSSQPALAASRSYESRTMILVRILHHQIFGFRVSTLGSRDFTEIIIDGSGEIDLQGDADHLGGGKTDDRMGDEGLDDLAAGMETDALNNLLFDTDH